MTRLIDVVAPMNEEGTKATVLKWGKAIGDRVSKDEPLLELETDKVTVEISAPASGELAEILKGPDEEVSPGQLLARVRLALDDPESRTETGTLAETGAVTEGRVPAEAGVLAHGRVEIAKAAASESAADARADARPLLSPSVRRLLAQHEISAVNVAGSGRNGRITAQDILRHVDAGAAPAVAAAERGGGGSAIRHTPIRRRIAEHMVRSLTQAPHVTTLFETDLTRVLAHRARHSGDFERQGARLTLTAYFIAACARALRAHPRLNATFQEDSLALHADANIGIGTALGDDGLIVPVLQRAQDLNLYGIALRLGQLVDAARAGKLSPSDVRGGTFTISNHGVGGSLLAAPIVINQPQVAILGVGKVERRVCALQVDSGEVIAVRSKCYLTLTIDHRAIDAFQANAFLSSVVTTLEQWPQD
jgi:2-oxoglutarate dehydrogenase E2 component (dihydrolipoamide succinyltransferase)